MRKLIATILLATTFGTVYSKGWETSSRDGVTIKSEVTSENDETVIRYEATKTTTANLDDIEAFMRQPSKYTTFLENTESCKKVKSLSQNKWITYMYFDAPWPVPNSDCVQEWVLTKKENGFTLSAKAVKGVYPMQDVDRMYLSNTTYDFTKVEGGKVKLTLSSHFSPVGSVPKWMIRQWFPKGPSEMVNKLFENVNK